MFFQKQVNDPVHGTIHLSAVECDIISTKVFQRLHNVKQLGLGVSVYPGANYSRFSHSLGACHLAGRMIDAIRRNSESKLSDSDKQLYRLGGLLHDIGHYPFSHSFEHSANDYFSGALLQNGNDIKGSFVDHEQVGGLIIENDEEILKVLKKHGIDAADLKNVFLRESPGTLVAVLSSDLDCDRLDYLMRTALHAGLPYGRIDLDYIVNAFTLCDRGFVCLKHKAMRAADHLLVSRYYDYTQLPFHKTVAALELSLIKVVHFLLEENQLNCSGEDIKKMIGNESWASFDDQKLVSLMRQYNSDNPNAEISVDIKAILERKPAKMVYSSEKIFETSAAAQQNQNRHKKMIEGQIENWANKFGIDKNLWRIWSPKNLPLTKYGNSIDIRDVTSNAFQESELSQLVNIIGNDRANPNSSMPIVSCENTIVHHLSRKQYGAIRVYINKPDLTVTERMEINNAICEAVED